MRKGHREKLVKGDEADAVSARARKILSFRRGERAAIKRRLNKRARLNAKRETQVD